MFAEVVDSEVSPTDCTGGFVGISLVTSYVGTQLDAKGIPVQKPLVLKLCFSMGLRHLCSE